MNKATKVFMSVFVLTLALVSSSFAQNTLFFSQYNEGGSNNKALEIYNPTADTVWLSGYAFPNVSGTGMNGSEFSKKCMHEAGVAIVPGTAFGTTSIDYVRFSFAASQDNIQKALEKIKKMLG